MLDYPRQVVYTATTALDRVAHFPDYLVSQAQRLLSPVYSALYLVNRFVASVQSVASLPERLSHAYHTILHTCQAVKDAWVRAAKSLPIDKLTSTPAILVERMQHAKQTILAKLGLNKPTSPISLDTKAFLCTKCKPEDGEVKVEDIKVLTDSMWSRA